MNTITNAADTPAQHVPPQASSPRRFRQPLGLVGLVLFGLAYMVPLAVFTTYGLVTQMTKGHLPTAYLLTLAAMLLTAYSYGRMVQAHPYSGSVYTIRARRLVPVSALSPAGPCCWTTSSCRCSATC
jgi:hypothetical protein